MCLRAEFCAGIAAVVGSVGVVHASPSGILPLPDVPVRHHVIALDGGQPTVAGGDSLVYDNAADLSFFFAPGLGFEVADDLHMTDGGVVASFDIAYFQPTAATVDAFVIFYRNDPGDAELGTTAAGPYFLDNLPSGLNTLTLIPPQDVALTRDTWFAIVFGNAATGIVITDPPEKGASHNLYLDVDSNVVRNFGTNRVANFYSRVRLKIFEVPVDATTWSEVKALYAR